MIVAPGKIKICTSIFIFYFMSISFEFKTEILHFYMYFCWKIIFISSTQAFSHFYFYSYLPTATF